MTSSIEVTISPTGQTTVHTKGFAGSSCRAASQFLEEALGKCRGEQLTSEFHQDANDQLTWRQTS
jgi:hypothetical protein